MMERVLLAYRNGDLVDILNFGIAKYCFVCGPVWEYPLSYGVPVRERYGSTLLPATREQHDQNCTQSH